MNGIVAACAGNKPAQQPELTSVAWCLQARGARAQNKGAVVDGGVTELMPTSNAKGFSLSGKQVRASGWRTVC